MNKWKIKEYTSIYNSIQKHKRWINLTKYVQYFYTEHHKIPLNEIKDLNKEMHHVQGLKTQHCYDTNSPQTDSNIQNPSSFLLLGNWWLKSEIYIEMQID